MVRWVYRRTVEPTTAESRRHIVDKQIIPYFDKKKISYIDTFMIDEFYEAKLEEGLSAGYIKIMHSILNQAFKKEHLTGS